MQMKIIYTLLSIISFLLVAVMSSPVSADNPDHNYQWVDAFEFRDQETFAPFEIGFDDDAASGVYIYWPGRGNRNTSPPVDDRHFTFNLDFEPIDDGDVVAWFRMKAINGNDSFLYNFGEGSYMHDDTLIEIDGWDEFWYNENDGEWTWVRVHKSGEYPDGEAHTVGAIFYNLVQGDELKVAAREGDVRLDRILITDDLDWEPESFGIGIQGETQLASFGDDVPDRPEHLIPSYQWVDAESASDQDGFDDYFRVVDHLEGYTYIEAIEDSPGREQAPEDGILEYNTSIEGELNIWLLVNMADPNSDSFYLGFGDIDMRRWWFNYEDHVEDYGIWVWVKYHDVTETHTDPFVGTGDDNLYLTRRETGAKLDQILFTDDLDFVPEDPDREPIPTDAEEFADVPMETTLNQNYPNPFNPVTKITYDLHENQHVRIEVFNSIGQLVEVIVDSHQTAGTYTIPFGGSNLSSGMYLYRMQTDHVTKTRKMMLIK